MLPSDSKIYCGHTSLAIRDIREGSRIVASSGWGDTSDTFVKDVFINYVTNSPLLQITTSRGAVLKCTPDQLCFGRYNPSIRMYSLYLHERSSLGYRIGLCSDIFTEAIEMVRANHTVDGRRRSVDNIWIIENNPNLTNSTFIHKLAMAKYGLPDIPFDANYKTSELNDKLIKELFNRIDTPVGAKELLRDSNMYIEYPHITLKFSDLDNPRSNSVQFVIFGGKDKTVSGHYFHLIQVQGVQDPNRSEQMKNARRQRSEHGLWFVEITKEDLEEAELVVKTFSNLDDLEVVKRIQLTKKSPYYIMPASHLKRGMLVPILNSKGVIEEQTVDKIELFEYKGSLYDLQVNELHNFIAGQWVVMCYTPSSRPKPSYI